VDRIRQLAAPFEERGCCVHIVGLEQLFVGAGGDPRGAGERGTEAQAMVDDRKGGAAATTSEYGEEERRGEFLERPGVEESVRRGDRLKAAQERLRAVVGGVKDATAQEDLVEMLLGEVMQQVKRSTQYRAALKPKLAHSIGAHSLQVQDAALLVGNLPALSMDGTSDACCLVQVAAEHGYTKIVMGLCASRLAARVLTGTVKVRQHQGRGNTRAGDDVQGIMCRGLRSWQSWGPLESCYILQEDGDWLTQWGGQCVGGADPVVPLDETCVWCQEAASRMIEEFQCFLSALVLKLRYVGI
jgi:hypothetical protein